MPLSQKILFLFLIASGLAVNTTVTTLKWGPCNIQGNVSVPISCSTLEVPRDYLSNSSDTISLKLARVNATKQPSQGTVLYNPGGPGDGGRNTLYLDWTQLLDTIGPNHDILTWDPRGTGDTMAAQCFPDTENQTAYKLVTPPAGNASDVALDMAWAGTTSYALSCAENAQDVGDLVGTAYTVRDMMHIVDALNEDGALRFYGQSYGTLLGQTAAAMFPDRIDKLVLDGVLNPSQYYNGRSVQQFDATDAVFDGFVAQCIASPDLCPAARFDSPNLSLTQQVYETLELLKTQPIVNGPYAGNIVGYGQAKQMIVEYIYGLGEDWHNLGIVLDFLLSRNSTLTSTLPVTIPGPFPSDAPESSDAIRCSDTSLRANSLDEIRPLVGEFFDMSRLLGDYIAVLYPITCVQWPFKAKEVYSGGWNNIRTKNPILFVSNTFDPITSLAGAKNASAAFPGSRVLVQNGYGHSSWGQYSTCTRNAINAYFSNGTLPNELAQCQPDNGLFANTSFSSLNY